MLSVEKSSKETLGNQNHNLLANAFWALSHVSFSCMFMGKEHYNAALRTSLWDVKM